MSEPEKPIGQKHEGTLERRGFLYTLLGGMLAAFAGWVAGIFPRNEMTEQNEVNLQSAQERIFTLETQVGNQIPQAISGSAEARISGLETQVEEHTKELNRVSTSEPIAHLEGGNELVVFDKKELTVIQQEAQAVFLNLVNANGGVGIRFYKDFVFGNEQVTNPWSIWIEGIKGYQSLGIIRDWRFTAALWDEDGKLLLGKLDPHPPANQPGTARFQVRGTVDEVQTIIEGNATQTEDIFQVNSSFGKAYFVINGNGNVVIGSPEEPNSVILHDTVDGSAYALQVTNGHLVLSKA
jgi:hypothetical protein